MKRLDYLDFELKIEREGDRYVAQVLRSPVGEASSTFMLPFSEGKLENLVLKLGHMRATTRSIHSGELGTARELGGKLFEAVFTGDVHACLDRSIDEARRRENMGLRIKLRLQEAADIADLPWEFLYDPAVDRFLAQSRETPIVRYIEMPEPIKPLTVNLPLQVLVTISSPVDYPRLDVKHERSCLEAALDPLVREGKILISWSDRLTLTDLQDRLQDEDYHIFHFIGHGGFDERSEEGVLVLENEQGIGQLTEARRVGTILHDHRSLRLAVLNSCEGARNSRTDPFAGVATTLIRQGIPAVVAMQFAITDVAAITFARAFYTALAKSYPVDAAMAEARKAIYGSPNDVEWGTPVLYTRAADGRLFNVEGAVLPKASPPSPQAEEKRPANLEVPYEGLRIVYSTPSEEYASGIGEKSRKVIIEMNITHSILQNRLQKWAMLYGFECKSESLQRWVFQRGSKLAKYYSFTLRKYFTEAVIEISGENPATIYCSMKVDATYNTFNTNDQEKLSKEMDLLIAHITGANYD